MAEQEQSGEAPGPSADAAPAPRRCHAARARGGGASDGGYPALRFEAIVAALLAALSGGFGLAAVLAVFAGFERSVGTWWAPALQAHGHVQLAGWLGLFIVGVSLFFVPRLAGAPIAWPRLSGLAVGALGAGVLLRAASQPATAFTPSAVPRAGLLASGVLEAAGIAFYLFMLVATMARAREGRAALLSVRPFLMMALPGWAVFGGLNAWLCARAAGDASGLLDLGLNRLSIDLFLALTLVPVALAFSVRTFPLYLRLPAPDWAVRRYAAAYLLAVVATAVPQALAASGWGEGMGALRAAGQVLKGLVLLAFTWRLDVLTRVRPPWTVKRVGEPGPERRPTRPGLPDYGEFGRFERLLVLGYVWLVVAALCEVEAGVSGLRGVTPIVDADALRHIILAGFVSSLLFGMAPRMIPGFLQRRQVACPRLVDVTFWLWLAAVVFRIGPLLLSSWLPEGAVLPAQRAFGVSGVLGWAATAALTWNLVATWRGREAGR